MGVRARVVSPAPTKAAALASLTQPPLSSMTAHHSPDTVEWLTRLIAHPTVSRDTNLPLIEEVQDFLDRFGINATLTFDAKGHKANLYATIGPADRPGICLSGHTDVVPTEGQAWDTDPFSATVIDGKLYGRGACDMKGFVAAVLAKVPDWAKAPLEAPIHLAFSYDEEVGCLGVKSLIADLEARNARPALCIVGEPTEMKPVTGHKGKLSLRGIVTGYECHSSLAPDGVNAVQYAAELITALKRLAENKAAKGPFDPTFDPPHTTVHVGRVSGGTALNIVPNDCRFDFEFRLLPGEEGETEFAPIKALADRLTAEMQAIRANTGFRFEEIARFPGLGLAEDHPLTTLTKALAGANDTGKVSFGTEAGRFQAAGVPTIVCGPGSIAQAHKPNEFVALSELDRCSAFLDRLTARAVAGTLPI